MLSWCLLAIRAFVPPNPPPVPRVWLYSLLACEYIHALLLDAHASAPLTQQHAGDYHGDRLLPHFISHYESLGVPTSTMFFDLLHDPEEAEAGFLVRHVLPVECVGCR